MLYRAGLADYGVIGEGEITVCELCRVLEQGGDLAQVNGIIFRGGQGFVTTRARKELDNIDALPWPDYDGFDIDKYLDSTPPSISGLNRPRTMFVLTSRSCPYQCTFCFHTAGRKYRQRSLDNVFEEMEHLVARYKVGFLCVADMVHYSRTERMDAYLQWTRDHGCPAIIMEEVERALLNFPKWIQEQLAKPEPITAVICYDYIMGARALRALEKLNVKVPDQLSVAALSIPPLASIEYSVLGGVEYDTYEMGQVAATEMIDALVQNRQPNSRILRGTWQDNSTVRAI
jgi:hypothetical protein